MAKTFFKTKRFIYGVEQREDGTLNISREYIYRDGAWMPMNDTTMPDAGMFINQQGGIDGLLSKCETTDDLAADVEHINAELRIKRNQTIADNARRREERAQKMMAAYNTMFAGEVTETTADSVYILLRKLHGANWGSWELPRMTIGYTCNQYDCDGRTATTIKLDRPIVVNGEAGTMFQIGAPAGHLTKYRRIWPDNLDLI